MKCTAGLSRLPVPAGLPNKIQIQNLLSNNSFKHYAQTAAAKLSDI
jgi:hypothetical protein